MLAALFGGVLIGLSASLVHSGARQIAGVSGILGGLLRGRTRPLSFGLWFVMGLVLGGLLMARFAPAFAGGSALGLRQCDRSRCRLSAATKLSDCYAMHSDSQNCQC